jgi:hypothetical protein
MRASEFITEAHHHRIGSQEIGQWTVHIDSHALVTIADRDIQLGDVINILTFACKYVPELKTIPRGKGAYFQDTNSLVSIYIRRSEHYPNELTLETVLGPKMTPSPPLFRRSVPPTPQDLQDTPSLRASKAAMRKHTQAQGRDAVSQDIEGMMPAIKDYSARRSAAAPEVPLNREQRRALNKYQPTQ